MWTVWLCVGVAVAAFAFGVAGLYLQKLLPEPHTSDRSRDMIGAIVGLISLLLALVLGTLVGSAYSFYSNQKSEIETFAARAIHLDLALTEFGPGNRGAARSVSNGSCKESATWCGARTPWRPEDALMVAEPLPHLQELDEYVASLDPQTPAQRQFASAAMATSLQSRRPACSSRCSWRVPCPGRWW